MSESQAEPTAEQVVEELRKLKVGDMLLSSASMFASLAYGKLAPDLRDLERGAARDRRAARAPPADPGASSGATSRRS